MSQRVVITGMGIVSAYGNNPCYTKEHFWENISAGKNAIQSWQPEGLNGFPVQYAATINFDKFRIHFSDLLRNTPLLERRGYFGYVAAHLALKDAGLQNKELSGVKDLGIASCSGVPEIHESELMALGVGEYPQTLARYQPSDHSGFTTTNDSMVAAIAAEQFLCGPVLNINGACAGAAQAIGLAYRAIQRGETLAMLAGGADSVTNLRVMSGLFLLGATATTSPRKEQLCCPFDKDRSGLVAGEGGAFLVLESLTSALQRGATIYAEVLGYGSTLDAYKVTAPHPEGKGAIEAMSAAISNAKLKPHDIDYINAHGTSTPLNDSVETKVIKKLFGSGKAQHCPPVSSTKSMIGHWISAAAVPESIATILGIYHSTLPPTINLQNPDPECDLDYVSEGARPCDIRYALSNSFGFGGINASIVLGRYS